MKCIKYKTYMWIYQWKFCLSLSGQQYQSGLALHASTWNSKFARQQQIVFYDLAYEQGQLLQSQHSNPRRTSREAVADHHNQDSKTNHNIVRGYFSPENS